MLLCCARLTLTPLVDHRLDDLLTAPLDWDIVLREGRRHGLLPLLHRHVHRLRPPVDVTARLLRAFDQVARQSLAATARLLDLVAALRAEGVEAIPYKGPVLAAAVYGNPALRHFQDLDLIVDRDDVAAATRVLRRHGLAPVPPLHPAAEAALVRLDSARTFADGDAIVELHWAVMPRPFALDVDVRRLSPHLRSLSLGGARVPVPAPEDLLLLLVLHGGKHAWERIGWLADVAELVRDSGDLDIDAVVATARGLRTQRLLRLALGLADRLLDLALPERHRDWIRHDRGAARLAHDVCARWSSLDPRPSGIIEGAVFHLRSRECWRDRLRYAARWSCAPTVPDWAALPLPAPLAWLYPVIRPFRLAGKYVRRAAGLARDRSRSVTSIG